MKDETNTESIGVEGGRQLFQMSTETTVFTKLVAEEVQVLMDPEEQLIDEEVSISSVHMAPSMEKETLKVSQEVPDVALESEICTGVPKEIDHDATGIIIYSIFHKINCGNHPIFIINFCPVKTHFFLFTSVYTSHFLLSSEKADILKYYCLSTKLKATFLQTGWTLIQRGCWKFEIPLNWRRVLKFLFMTTL